MIVKYRVKEHRIAKGYSIRKLAALSGVSASMISDIENNKRHPTVFSICLLAKALDVPPEALFFYEIKRSE